MLDLHTIWEEDKAPEGIFVPEGFSVRWYFDGEYETRGSFAYETEEETRAAEEQEIGMLETGELVALGCVIMDDEKGDTVDSLWGIVIEPTEEAMADFFQHSMEFPDEVAYATERWEAAREALNVAHERMVTAMVKAARQNTASK